MIFLLRGGLFKSRAGFIFGCAGDVSKLRGV